jgi:hypothetical protein
VSVPPAVAENAKLKMQKAKVKIADSEFYIFNFAFLIDPSRPLTAGGTDLEHSFRCGCMQYFYICAGILIPRIASAEVI